MEKEFISELDSEYVKVNNMSNVFNSSNGNVSDLGLIRAPVEDNPLLNLENMDGRTFGLPTRQSLWSYCQRHVYRRGNTTDKGIATASIAGGVVGLGVILGTTTTPVRGGYVVGILIHSGNTTIAGRGGDVVGLIVAASSIGGGLVGI
ncbi:hypothetical protein Tco_0630300 [Tanacetum coccineum]